MFHVELRQFPHATRAFNLTADELGARILEPWSRGEPVELEDRSWAPDRARLVIYEGPELRAEEMGLGRGWANVTRTGEDVTARMLSDARGEPPASSAVTELKQELIDRTAASPIPLVEVAVLAAARHPTRRPSEALALAEQAVWELLHQRRVVMTGGDGEIESGQWQSTLLTWSSWTDSSSATAVTLVAHG